MPKLNDQDGWLSLVDNQDVERFRVSDAGTVYVNGSPLVTSSNNVLPSGGDDTAVLNAAIAAASAAGGGTVSLAEGTYLCGDVALKDNVRIEGVSSKSTILKAKTGTVTAVLLGTSGDTVTDAVVTKLTIDGNNTGGVQCGGVQVTSGARILVNRVTFIDIYKSAVLLTGTPDSEVSDCVLTNIGISETSSHHTVYFNNGSHRGRALRNTITGSRQMGVAVDSSDTPTTDCEIGGNYVENTATTIGFEAIGVTAGCIRTKIRGNQCINSQDNGISISAAESIVANNVIDGTLNHGIGVLGNDCVITDNIVRNCGQDRPNAGTGYGGVRLDSVTNCVVTSNRLLDDQAPHTMDYGIKEFGTAGGHIYDDNRIVGALTAQYLLLSDTTAQQLDNRLAVTQPYSASIGPDASTSVIKTVTVTNAVAFTIQNPTNASPGRQFSFVIVNSSGGAMGTITWGSKYQLSQAFVNPSNGARVSISFFYDGTNWIETSRTREGVAELVSNKGIASGYAGLDSGIRVARANIHEAYNQFYFAGSNENIHATFDRRLGTLSGNALTSQVMMCTAIFLPAGATITSLSFRSGTALTQGSNNDGHWWFALYDTQATPALIAQTADQTTTTWAATTIKTIPLGSPAPYLVTVSGIYYVAIMVYAGTGGAPALPSIGGMAIASSTLSTGFASGQKVLAGTSGSALTTTAPPTIAALGTGTLGMYCETS
jgi:hypothetical protein